MTLKFLVKNDLQKSVSVY